MLSSTRTIFKYSLKEEPELCLNRVEKIGGIQMHMPRHFFQRQVPAVILGDVRDRPADDLVVF